MEQGQLINSISQKIIQEASRVFRQNESDKLEVGKKNDQTVVTNLDIKISNIVKEEFSNAYKDKFTFFCEEEHDQLRFPAIVLDPIDGTQGLITRTFESAVSLGVMENPLLSEGLGWVFNPFTGFSLRSDDPFVDIKKTSPGPLLVFVSRSEWDKGLYAGLKLEDLIIVPMGSIAYKLGLLASGACDLVFSWTPKHIWDIAAGTILCHQRGIYFFNGKGQKVTHLEKKIIAGPMFWSKEDNVSQVIKMIEGLEKA